MLSVASKDQIIVTHKVWKACGTAFQYKPQGQRQIKGKGLLNIYEVLCKTPNGDNPIDLVNRKFSSPTVQSGEGVLRAISENFNTAPSMDLMGSISSKSTGEDRPDGLARGRLFLGSPSTTALQGELGSIIHGRGGGLGLGVPAGGQGRSVGFTLSRVMQDGFRNTIHNMELGHTFGSLSSVYSMLDDKKSEAGGVGQKYRSGENWIVDLPPANSGLGSGMSLNMSFGPDVGIGITRKGLPMTNETNLKTILREVTANLVEGLSDTRLKPQLFYFQEISKIMNRVTARYANQALEKQYLSDFCAITWHGFVRDSAQGLLCEILMLVVAVIYANEEIFRDAPLFYYLLAGTVATIGLQGLLVAVSVFHVSSGGVGKSASFTARTFLYLISVFTFSLMSLMISFPWTKLYTVPNMTDTVIPFIAFMYATTMDGMILFYKLLVGISIEAMLVAVQLSLKQSNAWGAIFSIGFCITITTIIILLEWTIRIEYILDHILQLQSELASEEKNKSAGVLMSILPQRIVRRLIVDPTSMVYEEFDYATVLHMDIAGFTTLSSQLEPIDIVQMLNKLFTHFDALTEEYNVEKITTIGDAYVASSALSSLADAELGAIAVCLVALRMQAYVKNHFNNKPFVRSLLQSPLIMRIGIHSGGLYCMGESPAT
ncbi:hypothetical protein HK102_005835 [Quaeritorhiza haematococci]|nr:hypothetical protein HK102_005835 [Quaeritorhiza haematococci]